MECALIKVFNERGILSSIRTPRAHGIYEGNPWELDIIAKNGYEIIVVEVKITLRLDDVKNFLTKLKRSSNVPHLNFYYAFRSFQCQYEHRKP